MDEFFRGLVQTLLGVFGYALALMFPVGFVIFGVLPMAKDIRDHLRKRRRERSLRGGGPAATTER